MPRTQKLVTFVDEGERRLIDAAARLEHRSRSQWMRLVLLEAATASWMKHDAEKGVGDDAKSSD